MAASASAAFSQGFLAHSSAHFCDKKFFYFKSLFAQSFRPASWQVRIRGDATCRRYLRVLARSEQLSEDDDDDDDNGPSKKDESNERDADSFRDRLEKIVGDDDAAFDGKDLATLIRNKYGRSYDVQLIKREFMGRQLLAMNVMWKYREQGKVTEKKILFVNGKKTCLPMPQGSQMPNKKTIHQRLSQGKHQHKGRKKTLHGFPNDKRGYCPGASMRIKTTMPMMRFKGERQEKTVSHESLPFISRMTSLEKAVYNPNKASMYLLMRD